MGRTRLYKTRACMLAPESGPIKGAGVKQCLWASKGSNQGHSIHPVFWDSDEAGFPSRSPLVSERGRNRNGLVHQAVCLLLFLRTLWIFVACFASFL